MRHQYRQSLSNGLKRIIISGSKLKGLKVQLSVKNNYQFFSLNKKDSSQIETWTRIKSDPHLNGTYAN